MNLPVWKYVQVFFSIPNGIRSIFAGKQEKKKYSARVNSFHAIKIRIQFQLKSVS